MACEQQLTIFDVIIPPPDIEPVAPDGPVVRGAVDEVLALFAPERRHPSARIELHRHIDDRWMWSTSYDHGMGGAGYRVGAKWGRFAASRDAALHWAVTELRADLEGSQFRARADVKRILAWAVRLR